MMANFLLRWRPAFWMLTLAALALAVSRVGWHVGAQAPSSLTLLVAGFAYVLLVLLGWPFLVGAQFGSLLAILAGQRPSSGPTALIVGALAVVSYYVLLDQLLCRWARRRIASVAPTRRS